MADINEIKLALEDFDNGKYDAAGVRLVSLYKKDKTGLVMYHLSRVYLKKGMYAKAEHLLKNVLRDNPDDYSAWYYLGLVYEAWQDKPNNLQLSKNAFLKISETAPNYESVRKMLDDVNVQIDVVDRLDGYHGRTDGLTAQDLLNLGFLLQKIESAALCSGREGLCLRVAQIYHNAKSALIRRGVDSGKSLSEARKMHENEFSVLERILGAYVEKAGFDIKR